MTTAESAGSPSAIATTTTAESRRSRVDLAGRRDLEAIVRAAIAAVDPRRLVSERIDRRGDLVRLDLGDDALRLRTGNLWIAGAGKAAVAMARGVLDVLPEARGVVVAPRRPRGGRVGGIEVLRGNHPVPGQASFEATASLLRRLRRRPPDDVILLLLSGGASALLARPSPGIDRADKRRLGKILLRCGADIALANAVRKHVSAIKGGGLLRLAAPRRVLTLALSDVPGDRLDTIGSGPGVPDPTSYEEAWTGLEALGALDALPGSVRRRLRSGLLGRANAPETVKPDAPEAAGSLGSVIGSNALALRAAASEARRRGYRVRLRRRLLRGEAAGAGEQFAAGLGGIEGPTCVLAGGETTVRVEGGAGGRGGRCQEFALAAAAELAGGPWSLLAAGTDGVDGETPAAGGFADGGTVARMGRDRLATALRRHDSHTLLASVGDDWRIGPTGTNVMDIVAAVARPPAR